MGSKPTYQAAVVHYWEINNKWHQLFLNKHYRLRGKGKGEKREDERKRGHWRENISRHFPKNLLSKHAASEQNQLCEWVLASGMKIKCLLIEIITAEAHHKDSVIEAQQVEAQTEHVIIPHVALWYTDLRWAACIHPWLWMWLWQRCSTSRSGQQVWRKSPSHLIIFCWLNILTSEGYNLLSFFCLSLFFFSWVIHDIPTYT